MSDSHADRIVRAAIPGRSTAPPLHAAVPPGGTEGSIWVPGRGPFEWSVMASAAALIFPVAAIVAGGLSLRARRQGSARWRAALVAALWCGLLGLALRAMTGFGLAP